MAAKKQNNGAQNDAVKQTEQGEGNDHVVEDSTEEEISLDGDSMSPLVTSYEPIGGQGYGVIEGGSQNGYTFAGQAERILTSSGGESHNGLTVDELIAASLPPHHIPFIAWLNAADALITDRFFQQVAAEQRAQTERRRSARIQGGGCKSGQKKQRNQQKK